MMRKHRKETRKEMEQNRELTQLYNTLMQVPHRNYEPLVLAFRQALVDHPAFASRAAVFVALNSKIRDQVDCAIISLLQADPSWLEFREAGQVLLLGNSIYETEPYPVEGLEPFRIFRIDQFIRDSDRKIPRRMTSIMTDYMTAVQENAIWFDSIVLHNRAKVKSVYNNYHIPMNDLAKAVLYDNAPPEGSKLHALKLIAQEKDVNAQARLIVENKIPYRIAKNLFVNGITPAAGIAMIDVMSPTEALNSRAWIERSGLLQMPEVRDVYVDKIGKATASVASADFRKSAQGSDEEVQAAIDQAKEKAVVSDTRISGQTDIWMDMSGSMGQVITITPEFTSRIWPLCDDVVIIAHNNNAWEIKVRDTGHPLQDVRNALRGSRATGGTRMAECLHYTRDRLGRMPQRIVYLTDEGETSGNLAGELSRYEQETGILPQFVIIRVASDGAYGSSTTLSDNLTRLGLPFEKFEFTGDYYIFDQITTLLQGEVPKSIIERVMEIDLPYRIR